MRIYLAASYGRRGEMMQYAERLRDLGHVITSTWIDGHHESSRGPAIDGEATVEEKAGWADEDLSDVNECDTVILFTDEGSKRNRGGKDFEAGYARGLGRALWVVGPRTNVFTCQPHVRYFPTTDEWLGFLGVL